MHRIRETSIKDLDLRLRLRGSLTLRVDQLLAGALLLGETSLLDGVLGAQLAAANEQGEDEADACDGSVEDPHAVQGVGEGSEYDFALGGG